MVFGTLIRGVGATARLVRDFRLDDPVTGSIDVRRLELGRVMLSTVRTTGYRMDAVEPDRCTFFSPLTGDVEITIGKVSYRVGAGSAMFVRPGGRTLRVAPPEGGMFYGVAVSAPVSSVAPKGAASAIEYRDIGRSMVARCLQGFLHWYVREFSRAEGLLRQAAMLSAAETLILSCLETINVEEAPEGDTGLSVMARRVNMAEAAMRERLSERVRGEELARDLGISERSLQAAFRAVRDRSPSQALTEIRLDTARQLLLSAENSMTVTEVAHASGIGHLGRFAQSYRRRFGESPSDTMRHVRFRSGSKS